MSLGFVLTFGAYTFFSLGLKKEKAKMDATEMEVMMATWDPKALTETWVSDFS